MFGRFAKFIQKSLPLSAMMASYLFNSLTIPHMIDQPNTINLSTDTINLFNNNPRIKHVRDLGDYIQKILPPGRSIILFELTGDSFIDQQVVSLAQYYVNHHSTEISLDFQFIFLEESQTNLSQKDEQNYFILYSPNGQKLINIDNYINKSKQRPNIKLNNKALMKRLTQSLNAYKQVGLDNIITEFSSINNDNNYVALYTSAKINYNTQKACKDLKTFEKSYSTKNKYLHKYVIKDQQTRRIFGIKQNEEDKIYLLVGDSKNLKKQFRQKANFFQINGKKYTNIDITQNNLNEIFVFPPIQKSLSPQQFVLNVYINKNINYEPIEQQIYQQLSKPQYCKLPKAIYYTNDVEQAAIYYQQSDYSKLSLLAYQPNTNLGNSIVKDLLTHTFQYQYKLKSNDSIDGQKLLRWVQDCRNNKIQQYFSSEKPEEVWAQQITGQQYKKIRDQPIDKVIYHYSHHCHGCKKFGGKYEQFAKNKSENHPNINFYRINNDNNKSQGIKNYNSTPVFVFYKKGFSYPFIYKVPFFTEKLFDSFLKITSQVKIVPLSEFETHLKERREAQHSIKELLSEIRI